MKKPLFNMASVVLLATGCTVAATSSAPYKTTFNGAKVYPLEGGVFEVAPPIGGTGYDYWCAGADYARRYLGAGWQTRFYVHKGMAPGEASGRKSTVVFTLNPKGETNPNGTSWRVNAFEVGDSMSVQNGNSQCSVFPRRWY